jgi:hypothetical protein
MNFAGHKTFNYRGETMKEPGVWEVEIAVEKNRVFDKVLLEATSIHAAIDKAESSFKEDFPDAHAVSARLTEHRLIK